MSAATARLARLAQAALEQIDIAIACWESARPADTDAALVNSMNGTLEANTFLIIRDALRVEAVLAIRRLWDERGDSLGFCHISAELRTPSVQEAIRRRRRYLAKSRLETMRDARTGRLLSDADPVAFAYSLARLPEMEANAASSVDSDIAAWKTNYHRYKNILLRTEIEYMRQLRNKRLTHHDISAGIDTPFVSLVTFRDTARILRASEILVQSARTLANDDHYSFLDSHRIEARYARKFWGRLIHPPARQGTAPTI